VFQCEILCMCIRWYANKIHILMYLSFQLTSLVIEEFQGNELYNCSPDLLGKFIIYVTLQSLILNY